MRRGYVRRLNSIYLALSRLIFCFCSELQKEVADETAAKEALQAAYASVQRDYNDLEEEHDEEGGSS